MVLEQEIDAQLVLKSLPGTGRCQVAGVMSNWELAMLRLQCLAE